MPGLDEYRRKGALRRKLSDTAARYGFRLYEVYLGETDLREPPPVEARADIRVSPATEDDLALIETLLDDGVRPVFRLARATGGRCLVAWINGAIAGWTWTHLRVIDLDGLILGVLPQGVGYSFGSYVLPAYRGLHVFQSLLRAAGEGLRAEGCRVAWNIVDRANGPSIAARRRLGTRLRPVSILKVPGLRPIILGGGLKAAAVSSQRA